MATKTAKRKKGKRKSAIPGPKPSITMDVVKRVSKRYALGTPLELALAAEQNAKINLETWKKALASHPEFSPHWAGARGKFLATSMERLDKSCSLKFLCYLLERRHSDLFAKRDGKPADGETSERPTELPGDVLERAQQLAKEYGQK